jgi:hypothetical protein
MAFFKIKGPAMTWLPEQKSYYGSTGWGKKQEVEVPKSKARASERKGQESVTGGGGSKSDLFLGMKEEIASSGNYYFP